MNGSERIMAMFERRPVDRPGFWMGAPTEEALRKYLAQTGLDSHESLSDYMQDDVFRAAAEWSCWRHPEGKPMWDFLLGRERRTIVDAGCFAKCDVAAEVRRLCGLLGDNFIVSPSHEGVLPNIPFENMPAMRDAVIKG